MLKRLEEIKKDLAVVRNGGQPSKNLLPKLAENWLNISVYDEDDETQRGTFRGIDLLESWEVTGEEVIEDGPARKTKTYTWTASPVECISEVASLVKAIQHSLAKNI